MADKPETSLLHRLASILVGVIFLGLGILGLIFPILPGWIFIFAALVSFASAIPLVRRVVSAAVRTPLAKRAIDGVAKTGTGRRLITLAMRYPHFRKGLTAPARWQVVQSLLKRAAEAEDSA